MNGFLRVALYARVSSQKQADEMTIQSQRQALVERIARDQCQLDQEFEFCDDGYSGSELSRPALETLRDRVAAAIIDRVYIHSPDRLARKFSHQALLLEEFTKHQCEVIFLNQEGMPEGPETNLLIQMQGMIAEYERAKILERTRRGRRYAAAAGRVSVFAGAPYGYRYVSKQAGNGEARWEIDDYESAAVRLMFDLVDQQNCSLGGVCRALKARSIPTKTGKADWDRATVRGILMNPAYYGEAKYGKQRLVARKPGKRAKRGDPTWPRRARVTAATKPEEQVTIAVPALITKSLFERVARQMEENRLRQRARQEGPKSLLSGLLICGQCGSAYCSQRQGGQYVYYRCLGTEGYRHGGQPICSNGRVKGPALESRVWLELCQLLGDPSRLEIELERRREQPSISSSQLMDIQRRIEHLQGQTNRLIDAYTSGLLTKPEFENRIGPLRDRHDREVSALASLQGELGETTDVEGAAANLQQLANQVGHHLKNADEALKRELLVLLVKRIEMHPTEIRIVYKVPASPFDTAPANREFLPHCWRSSLTALR